MSADNKLKSKTENNAKKDVKKPSFKSEQSEQHKNHRNNMRQKFLKFGLECFEEHEIIEILLYHTIPMKDTNPLAHKLINEYGSLAAIFDSSYEKLRESGLTHNSATFFKLIQQVSSYYTYDRFYNIEKRLDEKILIKKFIGITQRTNGEAVILGLYDLSMRELFLGVIDSGGKSGAHIIIEKVLKLVYNFNAYLVVLAHNHPSGVLFPSKADFEMTDKIEDELSRINVHLYNHYIIANEKCISIRNFEKN